jgi:DNA repair protein RadC
MSIRLETHHPSAAALDRTMILFDDVIEVSTADEPKDHSRLLEQKAGNTLARNLRRDLPRQAPSSISYREMFRGTIDGVSVHPREVVKEALKQILPR